LHDEYGVSFEWRGFQLHPEIPPGGVRGAEVFGAERVRVYGERLTRFAAEFGVDLQMPERIPSTMRPLAVTEFARDHGALAPFRDAVMNAHWHGGKDIESDECLGAIAEAVGLDREAALSAGDDELYVGRVEQIRREAHERMVSAIPTFFFGDFMVVGCQTWDTVEKVARKVGLG
jgi:predicted DsbA family dithiol-disulfide isomerase